MKIIMIYDQIQSGAGIKDDHDIPLGAKKEAVGPAVMMEPFLKKVDGKVVACLYCGDGTYLKNPDEVSRKLCAMVNKLKPDVVMCGPCFNYLNYGKMAARIAYDINQNTSSKAIAAMSDDNQETINEYKDKLCIIKTPKKGGIGLNESLEGMCVLAKALYQEKEIEEIKEKFPNKTIWIYSGYDWQDVKDLPCMKYVDVMVDGEFVDGLKDNKLLWRGSTNQKVIDVQKSLEIDKVVLAVK